MTRIRLIMTTKTPESASLRGFLTPFLQGGLILRLAADCYLRSSHLLMALAIMPAMIEERNDKSSLITITPFPRPYRGWQHENYNMIYQSGYTSRLLSVLQ